MLTNVLQYLERTVLRVPDKLSYASEEMGLTFQELSQQARSVGTRLYRDGIYKKPVVVFMAKGPKTPAAFFGAIYAGNAYVPLDEEMPRHRMELIFETLQPAAIICDESTRAIAEEFDYHGKIYTYEEICEEPEDAAALSLVRAKQLDTDPVYIMFTSGSTGVPKGVVACHRSVIDYIEHLTEIMRFNEGTVFGSQTPLYFDASMKEVYPTIQCGATTYFIPKQLFMFPVKLVEFLNRYRINTICWVVSALTMVSAFRAFEKVKPEFLHTIGFGGEVFPIKQYQIWRAALPHARFVNLYGPTEITGVCTYYEVDREFSLEETLPIGFAFPNTEIILLDENDREPPLGEQGEICVRGTGVTLGYYCNPEKTSEVFVQNPLNKCYPEIIYRTGDLAKYNARGELVFVSRKDFQVKHMGHRIELGEIEAIVDKLDTVRRACCVFDGVKKKIALYYEGDISALELTAYLKEKFPRYMVPSQVKQLDALPLSLNGKIDRKLLKQWYEENKI
ncbi:MAG TPA: amino acid adenylation domain-containing protein [Candidatus Faecousia intestinigallinarum]|nr:amino acid adenylation domain-containing protein [Candidatus Faecousia intestinigallinarum]